MKGWITLTGFESGTKISVQISCIAAIADPDPEPNSPIHGPGSPVLQLSMGGSIAIREDRVKVLNLIRYSEGEL